MTEKLQVSKRTVSRIFKNLQEKNINERIGSNKTGYWNILKQRSSSLAHPNQISKVQALLFVHFYFENNRPNYGEYIIKNLSIELSK